MGGMGEGFLGTSIKDTCTKPRGWDQGWEVVVVGVGGSGGEKMRQLYLNNNKKNLKIMPYLGIRAHKENYRAKYW